MTTTNKKEIEQLKELQIAYEMGYQRGIRAGISEKKLRRKYSKFGRLILRNGSEVVFVGKDLRPAKGAKNMTQNLSSCCSKPVIVAGGDEGTNHYECTGCNKACDIRVDKQEKWVEEFDKRFKSKGTYTMGLYVAESVKDFIRKTREEAKREEIRKYVEKKFIDSTPNGMYALRILQAYRSECDIKWTNNTAGLKITNPFLKELNYLQKLRAKELDKSIDILTLKEEGKE